MYNGDEEEMLTRKDEIEKTTRKGCVAVDDIGEGGRAKNGQTELKGMLNILVFILRLMKNDLLVETGH